MSCDILLLPGIPQDLATRLHAIGLNNSDKLLTAVSTPATRAELAHRLQVSPGDLLALGRTAELIRIHGIGSLYADILAFIGIRSISGLATCDPEQLQRTLKAVATDRVIFRTPGPREVRRWVEEAKSMGSILQE